MNMDYSPTRCLDLPRRASISPEELESEYISRGIPVVLTAMTADWPAMKKWTLSYFRDAAGQVEVPVRGNRYHFRLFGTIQLADYIDWLNGARPNAFLEDLRHTAPYITHNRGIAPHLEADVSFHRFAPPGYRLSHPAFWIGPPKAETPLHYDSVGIVFFAQIIGRKEATLFPKEQSELLYEGRYFDYTTSYSQVNLRDVDYRRFPRFTEAVPYRTVLHPGEVLVFPRRLWHEFRTLDKSVSVTMHAGTSYDYSYFNPALRREWTKQALHWFGLYARGCCSCHSNIEREAWEACMDTVSNAMALPQWIKKSRLLSRAALAASRGMLHQHSLGDVLGWPQPVGDTSSGASGEHPHKGPAQHLQ